MTSDGKLNEVQKGQYHFDTTETGNFGYKEEDIEEINNFYTEITKLLDKESLIFDTEEYYSYFVTAGEEEKRYEDALSKILPWFDDNKYPLSNELPFGIEAINNYMEEYGYPEYIINEDDIMKVKLEKMYKAFTLVYEKIGY